MRVPTILSAATAVVLGAGAAGAQAVTIKPDSGCVTTHDGRVECRTVVTVGDGAPFRMERSRMDSAMMKRAVLGIELRPTGTKRDTLGVFVESVIPKGPAETAGVVEGDRIAAINGVDLRVGTADVDDPYTNGLAAHRLTREVQKLAPGARVSLRVYAGGRYRDVQVTAGRASDFHQEGMRIRMGGPGMMQFGGRGMMRMEGGPEGMGFDPAHLKMMMEEGMAHSDVQVMRMRAPGGPGARGGTMAHPPMPVARRIIRI